MSSTEPGAAVATPWPISPRRSGAFRRLYAGELRLLLGRRRNQALLAVLAVVPLVIGIAVRLSTPRGGDGPQFLGQITGNGLFLVFTALTVALPFFLPLVVGVVAGDSIAGEAGTGTLRYLLTVPVGRTRLLAVKYAGIVYGAFLGPLVVAVSGLIVGLLLFGGGDVTLFNGGQVSFADGLLRLLGVCLYLGVCLSALGAVGLFLSTLTEQPMGATIALTMLTVASFVLGQIPQLDWLHPYLLTRHWNDFGELLRDPVSLRALWPGLLSAAAYIVIFLPAAWARFSNRDVTS
jgi:ABC-2 type transport system permease protein